MKAFYLNFYAEMDYYLFLDSFIALFRLFYAIKTMLNKCMLYKLMFLIVGHY